MPIANPGHKWNPILVEGVPDTCIHCDVGKLQETAMERYRGTWYYQYICPVCDRLVSKEDN